MKLLNASQIKEWDQLTIKNEPISSIDLMERAANACCTWILFHFPNHKFSIFCGKGNNGGDGLAIARLLSHDNAQVEVFILNNTNTASNDFNTNLQRLNGFPNISVGMLDNEDSFPDIPQQTIIIDALYGIGLNRKLNGLAESLVKHLNQSGNEIIAIDLPSGLLADASSIGSTVINATHTLTFQVPKMALLLAENEVHFGQTQILDIGLHEIFQTTFPTDYHLVDQNLIDTFFLPRKSFSHKGSYGHALLIAGSYGKMGAAVLSARSCLRSGVGLLTMHVPQAGVDIMQSSVPEAMCNPDKNNHFVSEITDPANSYAAIGIGPGLGTDSATATVLYQLLSNYSKPIALDADALNLLSQNKDWLSLIPSNSILTPHPKEFSRLFGKSRNNFEQLDTATRKARELNIIIVLKGHRSFIATPSGIGYFNTTGNAGMATGGSGDVLTGIITGLLAQGYEPEQAAIFGVYLHGYAGDIAASKHGMEGMIAGDIINELNFTPFYRSKFPINR